MDYKEEFIKFLKKNRCYKRFEKVRKECDDIPIQNYLDNVEAYVYLLSAFKWDNEEKKHDYWSALNLKWLLYLENN
jgi:hypothetical protein